MNENENEHDLMTVTITRRHKEAEGIVSLELASLSGAELPAFEAGAHVDVYVAPGLIRQYSLCNNPNETHRYLIGVLQEPQSRGGSAAIHAEFAEGRSIQISRPRNNFQLDEAATHTILAAGGIGITPLLAMAWRLSSLGASFELHYCARSAARTAFRSLLEGAPFADRVFLHLDDGEAGQHLDVETMLAPRHSGTHLYVCGPSGYIRWITGTAKRLHWADDRIHVEYFSADTDVSGGGFTVRAAKSGLTLEVPANKTIAEALEDHGVPVPMSCEQGICGTCLTRVLEGTPDHRDLYLNDAEHAANDQMTLCCSRAKSSILVLEI